MTAKAGSGTRLPASPFVATVGDSVIAGLGVGGRSYAKLVAEQLDASRFLRLSRSTNTVHDSVGNLDRLRVERPDLVIVSVGGSDGLVHAGSWVQRTLDNHGPKSWQGMQGLDPRTYLSGGRRQRVRQRVTSFVKVSVKHVGIRLTGGSRRVEPDSFSEGVRDLLAGLAELECVVVVVGVHAPDEKLFPRSPASLLEYERLTLAELANYPDFAYVSPKGLLHMWNDFLVDRAHFNDSGHAKVAEAVLKTLRTRSPAAVT
jgi:lysophospholipase L1-like esterase